MIASRDAKIRAVSWEQRYFQAAARLFKLGSTEERDGSIVLPIHARAWADQLLGAAEVCKWLKL